MKKKVIYIPPPPGVFIYFLLNISYPPLLYFFHVAIISPSLPQPANTILLWTRLLLDIGKTALTIRSAPPLQSTGW